jgi:hypothetical protein
LKNTINSKIKALIKSFSAITTVVDFGSQTFGDTLELNINNTGVTNYIKEANFTNIINSYMVQPAGNKVFDTCNRINYIGFIENGSRIISANSIDE